MRREWSPCVLVALRDALRRREIYVAGAHRRRDPDDDLPGDFDTSREFSTEFTSVASREVIERDSAIARLASATFAGGMTRR